jgi:hypothetical protein
MNKRVCNNYGAETELFQQNKKTADKATMLKMMANGIEAAKGIGVFFIAVLMLALIPTGCGGGSSEKELKAATVVFALDDVFQLEKGLVVTGEMLTGTVRVGDEMIHYNDVGEKVFTCKITAIEQPPSTGLKEASADAQRKHFGFLIEGKKKADFDTDGYLTDGDLMKWVETLEDE